MDTNNKNVIDDRLGILGILMVAFALLYGVLVVMYGEAAMAGVGPKFEYKIKSIEESNGKYLYHTEDGSIISSTERNNIGDIIVPALYINTPLGSINPKYKIEVLSDTYTMSELEVISIKGTKITCIVMAVFLAICIPVAEHDRRKRTKVSVSKSKPSSNS